ncbi:unnamed protein product [Musa hybrid cultivar]
MEAGRKRGRERERERERERKHKIAEGTHKKPRLGPTYIITKDC